MLRRLAAGKRVDDQVDWKNVLEEIKSVGLSETDAVEALLYQAILHLLKIEAWPASRDVTHWQAEVRAARARARRKLRESMRAKLDVAALNADALVALLDTTGRIAPQPVDSSSTMVLDDLLSEPNG